MCSATVHSLFRDAHTSGTTVGAKLKPKELFDFVCLLKRWLYWRRTSSKVTAEEDKRDKALDQCLYQARRLEVIQRWAGGDWSYRAGGKVDVCL